MRAVGLVFAATLAVVAGACHSSPPPVAVTPRPNADSIAASQRAREEALARARQDSIDRARREAEQLAERRRADSIAGAQRSAAEAAEIIAAMIHFDFDKSEIRPGDARVLDEKIPVLLANRSVRIRVVGNCDERGSDEYNLALGNRRAIAAKQYLAQRGIDPNRIETVSNGEEHPVDPGHTEEAWAKNRNDQFNTLSSNVAVTMRS